MFGYELAILGLTEDIHTPLTTRDTATILPRRRDSVVAVRANALVVCSLKTAAHLANARRDKGGPRRRLHIE